MHWFVVDETNKNSKSGQFFILGGLVFREDQIKEVDAAVTAIREKHGYRPGDQLKFQSKARPRHVTVDDARRAKQDVVNALARIGVRMITYVLLHDIGANKSEQERMEMGLNTVSWAYYRLLQHDASWGCMIIDRDDKQHAHLTRLFQEGIKVGTGPGRSMADRIKFYGMTSDNASHLSSAVDIALGGFRYCVNAASREEEGPEQVTAQSIFKPISQLIWGIKGFDGTKYIGGYGYIARPRSVSHYGYRAQYQNLAEKLVQYSHAVADETQQDSAGL